MDFFITAVCYLVVVAMVTPYLVIAWNFIRSAYKDEWLYFAVWSLGVGSVPALAMMVGHLTHSGPAVVAFILIYGVCMSLFLIAAKDVILGKQPVF